MRTVAFDRILGNIVGDEPGPTVVLIGALHGNEPAGVLASQRVLRALDNLSLPIRGELLALVGNRAALNSRRRFAQRDLNRCWTEPEVRALLAADPAADIAERAEQRELLNILGEVTARARGPLIVFDLHTTSAKSAPFLVLSDTLRNREIARKLPGTMILGLEEAVDGTLLDYLSQIGHCAVVIESGQHDDPESVTLHESFIWLALAAAGTMLRDDIPGLVTHQKRLREAARGAPRCVDLLHRHPVLPGDAFEMNPGHRSFERVGRGQVVAQDKNGPIEAPFAGLLLMPLYQRQGSDGFFLVRPIRTIWLRISRVVRVLKLDVLLPLLPGVARDASCPGCLRVDARVARWLTADVLHLFGYRQRPSSGAHLRFVRRS